MSSGVPRDGSPVLAVTGLGKRFREGPIDVSVLEAIDLEVAAGARVAITGRSGAGKSTLLHLMGALDLPSRGSVSIGGITASALDEAARSRLRARYLGFVYQFHHLLPEFSALENVALPILLAGGPAPAARQRARDLLGQVGLADRAGHRPGELSGGERQRVAVVRALANEPACVLADEPTGNLDGHTAAQLFDLLLALNRDRGTALVLVTHDEALAARLEQRYHLAEGRLHPVNAPG